MKNILIPLPIIMLLTSCSVPYVSTNLDKSNFSNYFSPSNVKIYKSESDIKTRYQFIDTVEGEDCQSKAHHALPDEINARTQARLNAFSLNANGVVFSKCAVLTQEELSSLNKSNDAQQCHSIIICYAKAYAIEAE